MGTDVLATQGAWASATMILSMLNHNKINLFRAGAKIWDNRLVEFNA